MANIFKTVAVAITSLLILSLSGCFIDSYNDSIDSYDEPTASIPVNTVEKINGSADFDFESYYAESNYIILAYFEIENGKMGQHILPDIDPDLYSRYQNDLDYTLEELLILQQDLHLAEMIWNLIADIIPDEYLRQIAYFELFTDGTDEFLGAVEELEEREDYFIFSLDINDMLTDMGEIDFDLLFDTIVHELGHIVTLSSDQVIWLEEEDSNPSTYFIFEYDLDTYPDSYLNLFFQRFWVVIYPEWSDFYYLYGVLYEGEEDYYDEYQEILYEYLDEFHDNYEDHFVTYYAATSPTEDIAESFMAFALGEKPSGSRIRDHKLLFFYEFSELVSIRSHIQSYLLRREI